MLRFAIVIRLFLRMIQVNAAEKPETLGSQCHRIDPGRLRARR